MRYTTRCPACETVFKVVPDQLKLSDGWVRCGHCGDVFDASLTLELLDKPARKPAPAPVPAPVAGPPKAQARGGRTGESSGTLPKTDPDFAEELKRFARDAPTAPPRAAKRALAPDASLGLAAAQALVDPADPVPLRSKRGTKERSKPAAPEPGFVRQGRRKAFWRSPWMRAVRVCTAVLLAVLLLAQWALQERNPLAAQYPAALPLLTQLCRPLACQLGPVLDIESVVIDSSQLVRSQGNAYTFEMVLKNSAPVAVAAPALELSLTDAGERVIARRVFLPHQLPGVSPSLPPQEAVSIGLRLHIADSGVASMTGYRALVFYP